MNIGSRKGIIDAERHRLTPRTLGISVKIICVRMLDLCEADSMRDPGTTLASATLAQKTFKYHRNESQNRCHVGNKSLTNQACV